MKTIGIAATLICVSFGAANAGSVERACLNSDRGAGNRALCSCIQDAANVTLTAREQQRAAKFFRDPQLAQDAKMSDRRSDEVFWERYKRFGQTASAFCG